MAKLSHTLRYKYVCEHCGKETDWFNKTVTGETNLIMDMADSAVSTAIDSGLWSSVNNLPSAKGILGNAIAINELKAILKTLKKKIDADDYTGLTEGAACPHCGQRQSWLPIHDLSTLKPAAIILLNILGFFALGMIFLALALFFMWKTIDKNHILAVIILGITVVLPFFGGISSWRRVRRKIRENRLQVESASVRHKPEIDWMGYSR